MIIIIARYYEVTPEVTPSPHCAYCKWHWLYRQLDLIVVVIVWLLFVSICMVWGLRVADDMDDGLTPCSTRGNSSSCEYIF